MRGPGDGAGNGAGAGGKPTSNNKGMNMADPVIAQKAPYAKDLAPGDYYWCSCGKSKNQIGRAHV